MNKLLLTTEPFLTGRPLEVWLDSMDIKDWSINGEGLVDADGDVNLHYKLGELTRLPVRFGTVGGGFSCGYNRLVCLDGGPIAIGGDFNCYNNQLVSLEGVPQEVGGNFLCYHNKLVNLEGAPKRVGGVFYCHNNQLTSLEGVPKEVGRDFSCGNNKLVSLKGAPKKVGGHFDCQHNRLVSLEGVPQEVGSNFWCNHNLLVDFKGMEGTSIGGSLIVTNRSVARQDNVIVSLEGLPKELYCRVKGLDIQVLLELATKQAASLSGAEVKEVIPEVELG